MDGLFHGTPWHPIKMDDLGGLPPIFGSTPKWSYFTLLKKTGESQGPTGPPALLSPPNAGASADFIRCHL